MMVLILKKCPFYAILKVPCFVGFLQYLHAKHFNFLLIYIAASPHLSKSLKTVCSKIQSLESLLCSEWSDDSVCCDWFTTHSECRK